MGIRSRFLSVRRKTDDMVNGVDLVAGRVELSIALWLHRRSGFENPTRGEQRGPGLTATTLRSVVVVILAALLCGDREIEFELEFT
jgi:hypothetical protein